MVARLRRVVKRAVLAAIHARDVAARRRLGLGEDDLPPSLWSAEVSDRGHLRIGGCDVVDLAGAYGTPLHVVDRARLVGNYQAFRAAFADRYPNVRVGFSYKTNPLPGALRVLHAAGADAEVISHFELWLALHLGVPPERIVYNGPGKTAVSLRAAVDRGVGLVNLDHFTELEILERAAAAAGRRQAVGVRVVTSVGWSSQFGLPISTGEARRAFAQLRDSRHLEPVGLHIHLGTGIRDVAVYVRAVEEVLRFALALERELGVRVRHFDLGGGFGVPTVRQFSVWDERLMANGYPPLRTDIADTPAIEVYGRQITDLVHRYFGHRDDADLPTLFLEPGRAIASSAQLLLLSVLAVKPAADGRATVILDGGKNITVPLGYESHAIFAAGKLTTPPAATYDLYGPLCHPSDIVRRVKRLPPLHPGDLIAVMDAGAYFVPNQMNFSNPRPAAVLVADGHATLTRSRESFEALVAFDQVPGAD